MEPGIKRIPEMITEKLVQTNSFVDSGTDEISSSGGASEAKSSPSGSISADSAIVTEDDTKLQLRHNDEDKSAEKELDNTLFRRLKTVIVSRVRRQKTRDPVIATLPASKEMADRSRRLKTFQDCGWNEEISMEVLADAGFYFSEENDNTVCYKCNLKISDWKRGDVPNSKHKKLSTNCEVVKHYRNSFTEFDAKISSPAISPYDIDDGRSGLSNPCEFYRMEFNRLVTFLDWPLSSPVDRYDLASCGLFSIREHGESDAVKCFACSKVIKGWQLGDRPNKRHASLSPSCPFLNNLSCGNKKLTDAEKTQIASLFRECEGGSRSKKSTFLQDEEPYTQKNSPVYETFQSDHILVNARYPEYYHESKRLKSYLEWPLDHCQQPPQLASAGFFSTGKDNEVQCFYCGGKLVGWEAGDVPLKEHRTHYPKCEWALKSGNQLVAEEETELPTGTSSSHPERVSENDSLIEELERLQDRRLCKICLDGDADILFLPCKHLAVCKECAEKLELCPMCRHDIVETIHVFMC